MFFDNLKEACFKKGTSPTALLKSLGMSTSSVTSWKKGVTPSIGTVYRLAEHLGVDPASLIDPASRPAFDAYNEGYTDCWEEDIAAKEKAPTLTKKDERDIARDLEAIMAELEAGGDMMFDGDPMTPEARESIMSAMRLGLEAAKAKNKERFTPHKYRKE